MFGLPKAIFFFFFGFLVFDLLLLSQDPAVKGLFLRRNEVSVVSTVPIRKPSSDFGQILALKTPKSEVLGAETQVSPSPSPTIPPEPKKKTYIIAAVGDSMVETMGDSLDYLKVELRKKYPKTSFVMYNYGVGAEKVSTADDEFNLPFKHGDKMLPALSQLRPDILIIGSFAYNPFDIYSRDGHWAKLSDLVGKALQITPNVYMLAEIAPSQKYFGQGPGGVNWPQNIVDGHLPKILEQMQNAIGIAKAMNIPLIDAYDKSRDGDSPYGQEQYISTHDHIHPSVLGEVMMAKEIADTIHLDQ